MSMPATTMDRQSHPLSIGDTLAESGDWPQALSSWEDAVLGDTSLRPAVERRLIWLLRETGRGTSGQGFGTGPMALLSGGTAGVATACVLLAGEPGTTAANLWATAAWILIVISIAFAILAARGPGSETYEELIHRARETAVQLEHDTRENGSSA